ncbi:MAG: DUF1836 domain-containing protein [Anaerovoracaceae bacterium]
MENNLGQFKLPRWGELPTIDLYLEQVLWLIDEWLGAYMSDGKKPVMTKTMVNNYVKQKFIAPPVNKKYDTLAVASLFVIAILKSVYTMHEISKLILLAINFNDHENAYNQFCQMTENAVEEAFSCRTMIKKEDSNDPRYILWNACSSFACQLYVKKTFLQIENIENIS